MRRIAFAATVALGMSGGAQAQAAEINAFMSTAVKAATDEILPAFERTRGHTIRASFAPSGALLPRFFKGEPVDIFVTDAPALDVLIKDGKIAGGRVDLVRTGIAIAVKKARPSRTFRRRRRSSARCSRRNRSAMPRPRAAASPAVTCSGCSASSASPTR